MRHKLKQKRAKESEFMTHLMHIHVAIVAALTGCVSTILLIFIWRLCQHKKDRKNFIESNSLNKRESHHEGSNQFDQGRKKKGRKDLFDWVDHPYLASDAVENGWSRFAFTSYKSDSMSSKKSTSSTLLGACGGGGGEYGREENEVEISWEVCQGSNEFMQKIRLNSGLKKCFFHPNNALMNVHSVVRTCLPLPGPSLGNHVFPQEAYFEITILYSCGGDDCEVVGRREGEKTKLLIEKSLNDEGDLKSVEEMKVEGKDGSVMVSLGLSSGGSVPLRVPGSYPRSIGFNSNGSVFLDGMKLVFESDKAQWIRRDTVIGCGFDPRKKKVFFTLDSELVHVIHCQSEEFSTPLCPTVAANIDIMILVNFGQVAFKYAPANAQRTPNPCFIAPLVHSPGATLGFDDSKELFSMGRIDSPWQNRSATKGNNNCGNNNNLAFDFDEESEADLFEIVLDGSEKSPYSVSLS